MSEKVEYLSSELIPFRHGFFTRLGGVSPSPYDSLNPTTRVGDTQENVLENRKRALAALKLKSENLAFIDLMPHGDKILAVSNQARGLDFDDYDAIMTDDASVVLGMSVADCAVTILASEKDGVIGMAHTGWRGIHASLLPKLVEAMIEEYDVDPANLVAVTGPHHTVDTYEFGADLAQNFDDRYIVKKEGKLYLDMTLAMQDQLTESGVTKMDDFGVNTFTDERFYSYRRENGDTGRFLVIATL